MIHSVYKTINLINQKYYIGKHSSEDPNDDYLGSGIELQRAIKKHGLKNFKKEILFLYESEYDAYNKEREILEKLDAIIPEGWSKGRTFKEGYKNVRN